MLAANNGRLDLCALLLDAGARVESTDGAGFTPLICACVDLGLAAEREEASLGCDPVGVVRLLLERGAVANASTDDGVTALALCLQHGELECSLSCSKLLEHHLPTRGQLTATGTTQAPPRLGVHA